ncbi:hypothetical protein X743_15925 [Mesorhizobium sp. LNHC252B00]|nr:hypothetical protein X743_15925 [Mesorhizobium sp. LNHC252B00]
MSQESLMAGEKVALTGAKETLLITLYGKALESRMSDSLLGDQARSAFRGVALL